MKKYKGRNKYLNEHPGKTRLTFMTNKGTVANGNVCIYADTDETVIIKNEKEKLHTKANDLFKGYKLLVKISVSIIQTLRKEHLDISQLVWGIYGESITIRPRQRDCNQNY